MTISLRKKVPDFAAACTGCTFVLSAFKGKNLVLYFYPKDSTPGCTTEGSEFRDSQSAFAAANTLIFGISRDSLKSHQNFITKFDFNFELISDTDEAVCTLFDVIKMKNMYGKQVRGIERSTFVIGADGKLIHEWRGIKVPGHVAEVLTAVQAIKAI
jgi:thioredoxin-dependent peroxiredoxin